MRNLWWLLIGLGIVAALWGLRTSTATAYGEDNTARLIYLLALAILIGGGVVSAVRKDGLAVHLRNGLTWVFFGVLAFLFYQHREDLGLGEIALGEERTIFRGALMEGSESIRFPQSRDGHYYVQAEVNNKLVLFMVDTGASNLVLTKKDADRVGIAMNKLEFTIPHATANGMVMAAPVTLHSLVIGPIESYEVEAMVNSGDLDVSLLGMSVLNALGNYEIRNGELILHK